MEMNLMTGETHTVWDAGGGQVQEVAPLTPGKALLTVLGPGSRWTLLSLDLERKEVDTLCPGRAGTYVPELDSVLFYSGTLDQPVLELAPLAQPSLGRRIMEGHGQFQFNNGIRQSMLSPPVRVSKYTYAVLTSEFRIALVNVQTGDTRTLRTSQCWPQAFREAKGTLICVRVPSFTPVELDLASETATELPGLDTYALVYTGSSDQLLFGHTVGELFARHPYDIAAYAFDGRRRSVGWGSLSSGYCRAE